MTEAPKLAYQPPIPQRTDWKIGMIGTGGISKNHLNAYRAAGWEVAAMWNRTKATAEERRADYVPNARVEDHWQAILDDDEIDIVDITLHPEHRVPIVETALKAGKHVLSQKPFVTDLDVGENLIALARDNGVQLAVNQNGRWAPHLAYMRQAVSGGHIGSMLSAHTRVHWDHSWTAGTPFDELDDLILYDFGVHWFDFVSSLVGDRVQAVFATSVHAEGQSNRVPMMAQAVVRLDGGQASLVFDGAVRQGVLDETFVAGTKGTLHSLGPDLNQQKLTFTNAADKCEPTLQGQWLDDGFRGTMGELMCAIESHREPLNGATANLRSLALTFAAVESRKTGKEVSVGSVRRLP
ncbi:MAG: Gfo/Idh/MocA family oxidoreductase [Pseudomonadota bacterium]